MPCSRFPSEPSHHVFPTVRVSFHRFLSIDFRGFGSGSMQYVGLCASALMLCKCP